MELIVIGMLLFVFWFLIGACYGYLLAKRDGYCTVYEERD